MGWKKRLKKERKELKARHKKLVAFLDSPESAFVAIPLYTLMSRQREIMGMYLQVLDERIANIPWQRLLEGQSK